MITNIKQINNNNKSYNVLIGHYTEYSKSTNKSTTLNKQIRNEDPFICVVITINNS